MKISVVIPALNEAGCIEETIRSVRDQPGPWQIVVADGGSTDGTPERAAPLATVVTAPRGRARQMNAGAALGTGEVLLFLHADTRLPPGALDAVRRALRTPEAEGGCFRLAFDRTSPLLRLYATASRLPWHRIAFGDRALFVRRSVFEAVGGFPDVPLFEDLALAETIHRRGGLRFLPLSVTSSSRRFEAHGPLRQQLRNAGLWLLYHLGTPPDRLAGYYPYGERVGGKIRRMGAR